MKTVDGFQTIDEVIQANIETNPEQIKLRKLTEESSYEEIKLKKIDEKPVVIPRRKFQEILNRLEKTLKILQGDKTSTCINSKT